jgi:alkylhydroperoxidase family enzyme
MGRQSRESLHPIRVGGRYLLNAWREAPFYTDRERAALAWTEAVTLISETHAPDDIYAEVRTHFSEAETVNLTMVIATIQHAFGLSGRLLQIQINSISSP